MALFDMGYVESRSKNIFKTKTFWLNVLGGAVAVASAGVIPPNIATGVLAVANIITRLATKAPAHVVD